MIIGKYDIKILWCEMMMMARQCRPLCLCVIWGDLGRRRPPVPPPSTPLSSLSCRSTRCGNIPKALAPGAPRHTGASVWSVAVGTPQTHTPVEVKAPQDAGPASVMLS